MPFFNHKTILAGEAAHKFHPVGGQGLNLCWRDVKTIKYLFKKVQAHNISSSYVPLLYFTLRITDVIVIGLFTDTLVRLFSNTSIIKILIRKPAITLLNKSKLFRKTLLSIMTDGTPSLSLFE